MSWGRARGMVIPPVPVHICVMPKDPRPVYVDGETGELVHNYSMMEDGKEYHVDWHRERYVLVRGDGRVAVYVR